MSLNKLTDTKVKKEWMKIYCAELKTDTLLAVNGSFTDIKSDTSEIITSTSEQVLIYQDGTTPIYLKMKNELLPVNQKSYGFYSNSGTQNLTFAQFNDIGTVNKNLVVYQGNGNISIPSANVSLLNGLNLTGSGSLLNVPSSTLATSFYEQFVSVGNTWQGAMAPVALEYKIKRVGNICCLNLFDLSTPATTGGVIVATQALPARLTPTSVQKIQCIVQSNTTYVSGYVDMATDGLIRLYASSAGVPFAATGNCGFRSVCITYQLDSF